jgi:hypothetical protein
VSSSAHAPQEELMMLWLTIGAAVIVYAFFKMRRRRLARDTQSV